MDILLADIGGTHARFAVLGAAGPEKDVRLAMAEFETLPDALLHYTTEIGLRGGDAYIATAAWPHADGTWRFARPGRWIIEIAAIEKTGWRVAHIGNDFGAGARGALALSDDRLLTIQPAGVSEIPQLRAAVLGSGTGLGLAYVCEGRVQDTYGGQMEVPQRTDEQALIVKLVRRLKENDRPVSAEDIISGPGLTLLCDAMALVHGQQATGAAPDRIVTMRHGRVEAQALRLYHEFLGLFAHQAVIYGHAFAALYLDGGVLHRLAEIGAFDAVRFLEYFIGDPLPLLKTQMQAMPVRIVTDPAVALHGLAAIAGDRGKSQ